MEPSRVVITGFAVLALVFVIVATVGALSPNSAPIRAIPRQTQDCVLVAGELAAGKTATFTCTVRKKYQ